MGEKGLKRTQNPVGPSPVSVQFRPPAPFFRPFNPNLFSRKGAKSAKAKRISQKNFSGSLFSDPNLSLRSLRLGVRLAFEPETCSLKLFLFQPVLI
jgi:hypothetical protein